LKTSRIDVTWTVRAAALDAAVAAADASRPRECCGILVGRVGEIRAAIVAGNLSTDPARFLIDPKDHIAARRQAREAGLEVVGFFHSHPHRDARPSPTDLAEAAYPDAVHLIIGFPHGAPPPADARLFRYLNGNFQEVPLVTVR
jgi:proteasome lid subunit RPN8/RPN11